MEITAEELAALVAAEVLKAREAATLEAVPKPEPAPQREVVQTSIMTYVPHPDEWTVRFRRFTVLTLNGQLTAYQRDTEAGFPSRVARQIIADGNGVRVGHDQG